MPEAASSPRPSERAEVVESLRQVCLADPSGASDVDLVALADSVAQGGLSVDEDGLSVPERTAVRLLEHGRPLVARDVMRSVIDSQPFFPTVRGDRVFAWLPGFEDPRAAVPDDVYDMSDVVRLRCVLDEVRWADGRCVLGGVAHLGRMTAQPDDAVSVTLRRRGGRTEHVVAVRVRRPSRVVEEGSGLSRLVWSGFRAEIDGDQLFADPAPMALGAQVSRAGLVRAGRARASSAAGLTTMLPLDLPAGGGRRVRVRRDGRRGLTLVPVARR